MSYRFDAWSWVKAFENAMVRTRGDWSTVRWLRMCRPDLADLADEFLVERYDPDEVGRLIGAEWGVVRP